MQALDHVEPHFEEVAVGAIRQLVDDLDDPPACGARHPDVRVMIDTVMRCVVLLGEESLTADPTRPPGLAGGDDFVD